MFFFSLKEDEKKKKTNRQCPCRSALHATHKLESGMTCARVAVGRFCVCDCKFVCLQFGIVHVRFQLDISGCVLWLWVSQSSTSNYSRSIPKRACQWDGRNSIICRGVDRFTRQPIRLNVRYCESCGSLVLIPIRCEFVMIFIFSCVLVHSLSWFFTHFRNELPRPTNQ